jgi:hypothetical protein
MDRWACLALSLVQIRIRRNRRLLDAVKALTATCSTTNACCASPGSRQEDKKGIDDPFRNMIAFLPHHYRSNCVIARKQSIWSAGRCEYMSNIGPDWLADHEGGTSGVGSDGGSGDRGHKRTQAPVTPIRTTATIKNPVTATTRSRQQLWPDTALCWTTTTRSLYSSSTKLWRKCRLRP